jgi:hypothetical protein
MVRTLEEQASISPWVYFGADLEVIEGWGRMRFEASSIVQNQDVPSPARIPICLRIEIENVRSQLAPRVAVRRDGATLPGEVPFQSQNETLSGLRAKHPAEKGQVGFPIELSDEVPPRFRQSQAGLVMQKITVMAALPIGTLDPYLAFEQGYVRKGSTETLETLLSQGVLHVDPRVGSLPLEGFGRDSLDTFMIQVFHNSPVPFSLKS